MNIGVITVSDRAFRGEYQDKGGPAALAYLKARLDYDGGIEYHSRCVPDDEAQLELAVQELSRAAQCCLIVTTGGTGLGARDITPQTTERMCQGMVVPGFGEAMRAASLRLGVKTAILSRAVAAVFEKRSLIINLPGSPNAIAECMDAVVDVVPHAVHHMVGGVRLRVVPAGSKDGAGHAESQQDPALHHAELKKAQ
ncbi:Molybdopterin adenylyltransferase [Porphyridium purpureum]|uniref:molybdopterin molybdotransferase n=1 Tax=Porphyridium purpureum TaxID=35688 RepID=A0A5J4Z301_PORPP|nr:Molybdopterin adenylyltransferase [Porphyridium purpureum]|eukprot:POR7696..scf295_1